jgi:hypothetical protein
MKEKYEDISKLDNMQEILNDYQQNKQFEMNMEKQQQNDPNFKDKVRNSLDKLINNGNNNTRRRDSEPEPASKRRGTSPPYVQIIDNTKKPPEKSKQEREQIKKLIE